MTSAELNWLIGLLSAAAYVGIGFYWTAPRYIRREMERHIREYPRQAENPVTLQDWRDSARWESFGPALAWPIFLFRFLPRWADKRAKLTEFELQKRIEQLEREAGIK